MRPLVAVTLLALLAGCSNVHIPFFGDKEKEDPSYASSRAALRNKSLEVPPDLTTPEGTGSYGIPGLSNVQLNAAGQKALETGAVLPNFDKVRMESAGGQRWLVISAPVETIWPQARQFWLDQGFKLNMDSPALGLLETNYMEQRPDLPVGGIRSVLSRAMGTLYSTGIVDQFRMRLERSADGVGTEVYISHQRMEEIYTGNTKDADTRWVPRKPDPEAEAAMLKKLLLRIGVTADTATRVVDSAKPADNVDAKIAGAAPRAELGNVDGKRAIKLAEGFDRSWRRVGLALERAGYTITDRDRQLGIYYVRPGVIQQGEKEKSFWSKLAFWQSSETGPQDKGVGGAEHLVVVSAKGEQTTVKVAGKDGTALPDATVAKLLDALVTELR